MCERQLDAARRIMGSMGFVPLTLDKITSENVLIMVDVSLLSSYGSAPRRLGDNGTTVICLDREPIQEHPNIAGRKVVVYRIIEGSAHKSDFAPIEELLRNEFDPLIANSSDVRYFARAA